jgi:carbon monoxide dehydrogenase subunit G
LPVGFPEEMRMINISNAINIDRSVAEVFAYTLDQHNSPKWQNAISAVEAPAGPVKKGDRFVNVRKFMGQEMKTNYEFMEIRPNSSFTLKSEGGPVSVQVSITFEPTPAGTKMTTHLEADVGGFFKVAEGMVAQQMLMQIVENDKTLKILLENKTSE